MPINLDDIQLHVGRHDSPEEGHCLLEVVSMFAGEPFSDRPACVDPVLATLGQRWNDDLLEDDDEGDEGDEGERQQLKRYIPLLVNTAGSKELSVRRSFLALDWVVRVYTPAWLALTPSLIVHADALRALPEIVDSAVCEASMPVLDAAWSSAKAAEISAWACFRGLYANRPAAETSALDIIISAAENAAYTASTSTCVSWDLSWDIVDGKDADDPAKAVATSTASQVAKAAAMSAVGAVGLTATGITVKNGATTIDDWYMFWHMAWNEIAPTRTALTESAHDLFKRMIELR